jgi:hypothetical protein
LGRLLIVSWNALKQRGRRERFTAAVPRPLTAVRMPLGNAGLIFISVIVTGAMFALKIGIVFLPEAIERGVGKNRFKALRQILLYGISSYQIIILHSSYYSY